MSKTLIKGTEVKKETSGFTKADLKPGMLVVTAGEKCYIVDALENGTLFLQRRLGWVDLGNFKEDLTVIDNPDYNIIKVYGRMRLPHGNNKAITDSFNNRALLWERKGAE